MIKTKTNGKSSSMRYEIWLTFYLDLDLDESKQWQSFGIPNSDI